MATYIKSKLKKADLIAERVDCMRCFRNSFYEGFLLLDADFIIQDANSRMEKLLGCPGEALLGSCYTHLLKSPFKPELYQAVVQSGENCELKESFLTTQGERECAVSVNRAGSGYGLFLRLEDPFEEVWLSLFKEFPAALFRAYLDGSGRILTNDYFLKQFKLTSREVTLFHIAEEWMDREVLTELIHQLRNRGECEKTRVSLKVKEQNYTCLLNIRYYPGQEYLEGSVTDVTINRDRIYTSFVEEQKVLNRKIARLQKHNRDKNSVLAHISHELRTPLNSILLLSGRLASMEAPEISDKGREFAGIIYTSSRKLLSLINNVLDLSRIKSGKTRVNNKEFKLSEVITYLKRLFMTLFEEKGIELLFSVDKSVPCCLCSDVEKLEQILRNLIGNSLKFTSHGSVTVSFSQKKQGELSVQVRDTGRGISLSEQQNIFHEYIQGENCASEGTGLGLAITKKLVEMLGGSISLKSLENQGTEFFFTIRYSSFRKAGALAEDILTPVARFEPEELRGKQILIVDTDIRYLYALSSLFESGGALCFKAADGEMALEHLKNSPHMDLLIMDHYLPDTPANHFIGCVKEHWPDLQLIIHSGNIPKNLSHETCLNKPLDHSGKEILIKKIESE